MSTEREPSLDDIITIEEGMPDTAEATLIRTARANPVLSDEAIPNPYSGESAQVRGAGDIRINVDALQGVSVTELMDTLSTTGVGIVSNNPITSYVEVNYNPSLDEVVEIPIDAPIPVPSNPIASATPIQAIPEPPAPIINPPIFLPRFRIFEISNSRDERFSSYSGPTCLSIDNDYVPIIYLKDGEFINVEGTEGVFMYNMIHYQQRYLVSTGRVSNACERLNINDIHSSDLYKHNRYTPADSPYGYYVCNHYVASYRVDNHQDIKVLMCAAVRSTKFKNLYDNMNAQTGPHINDVTILVDKSFMKDEHHFKFFRNVKRTYLDVIEEDRDVIYTRDINSLCFNPLVLSPTRFRNLLEREQYMDRVSELVKQELRG